MKTITILMLLMYFNMLAGQTPFLFTMPQDESDYIADVALVDTIYYAIQNRIYNIDPNSYKNDGYSDLLVLNQSGQLIEMINLNGALTKYNRILEAHQDYLLLVGNIETDTCQYKLVISKIDLHTQQLEHLSYLDFCHSTFLNVKIRKGLDHLKFLDLYHIIDSSQNFVKKIYRIEDNYSLTEVLEANVISETFGVDFSGKGYVISDVGLYNFYDRDFNYRKQKFTDEFHGGVMHQTHTPFRHHLMLEQSVQYRENWPNYGQQIRLVDSNLVIQKMLVVLPPHSYTGEAFIPFYDGISIANENEIWAAANYSFWVGIDSSFFTFIKLDSQLNIQCQHFIGYDSDYTMFGINALENGGAIVFGRRLREGFPVEQGEDVYALRVGENCELPPIVSTADPDQSIIHISAYPNPGNNSISFDMTGFDPALLSVEFINLTGQILFKRKDLTYTLEVDDLPPGQYFYRIFNGNSMLGVGSWVKQ